MESAISEEEPSSYTHGNDSPINESNLNLLMMHPAGKYGPNLTAFINKTVLND